MEWFKWFVFSLYSMEVVVCLAKANGWRRNYGNGAYAITAVLNLLVAIGIVAWL